MSIIEIWSASTCAYKKKCDCRPLVWILLGMIFIVGEKSLVVTVRWEKREPSADSRGGVALRRTGGKSTTRCTDLEMCDRRRTRNSSEAVRKSNYENVEHATQDERGKEKNRKKGRGRERTQKESPVEERAEDQRFEIFLCRTQSRNRVDHIEMSSLEEYVTECQRAAENFQLRRNQQTWWFWMLRLRMLLSGVTQ